MTPTPTAGEWLRATGEIDEIGKSTGLPVRVGARRPGGSSPHPKVDGCAVVPASANAVAELGLGIADNQALAIINEAVGTHGPPVVVFPRIDAAHARHPAWVSHIAALRTAGVDLIHGDDGWPLHEPRSAPDRDLPWSTIRARVIAATSS